MHSPDPGPRSPVPGFPVYIMTPERRNFLFRALLTLLTLGAVFWYAWKGRDYFSGGFSWDWRWGLAAVGLAPLVLLARVWKWLVLARTLDRTVGFGHALRSYVGCLPLGIVTPGRLGEYSRGYYLPQPAFHGMAGAGRVFLDNWTDMVGAVAWAAMGWIALQGWERALPALCVVGAFLPLGFWLRVFRRAVDSLPRLRGLRDALGRGVPDPAGLPPGRVSAALGLSIGAWACEWLQAAALIAMLGQPAPNVFLLGGLLALVAFANSIQVTLAGLGIREGLAAWLLAQAGVDFRVALVAAFCQSLLNHLLPALAGLPVKPAAWPRLPARREPIPASRQE